MKCPDIPVPERMAHLPRDPRGYPIPFFLSLPDGEYSFQGMYAEQVYECGERRLCGICGKPLDYWIAFVGGPLSTQNRAYSDPPFHEECAVYASQVCPFMVYRGWDRTRSKRLDEARKNDPIADASRPTEMIIGITRGYKMIFPYAHKGNFTPLFKTKPLIRTITVYQTESADDDDEPRAGRRDGGALEEDGG